MLVLPKGIGFTREQILELKWMSVSEKDFKWHQSLSRAGTFLPQNPYCLILHSYSSRNKISSTGGIRDHSGLREVFLFVFVFVCGFFFFCIRDHSGLREVHINRKKRLLPGKNPVLGIKVHGSTTWRLGLNPLYRVLVPSLLVSEDLFRWQKQNLDPRSCTFRMSWLKRCIITKQIKNYI